MFKYNKQSNSLQEQATMPQPPSMVFNNEGIPDDPQKNYEYMVHVQSLRSIPCHSSCLELWQDGQEYEKDKDYKLRTEISYKTGCEPSLYSIAVPLTQSVTESLTPIQKLHAVANKYYLGGAKWWPKAGDYYTSCRADLELYQVVEVTDAVVKTKYCNPERGDSISEWDKDKFLTDGFGTNRVHVPDWVFRIK